MNRQNHLPGIPTACPHNRNLVNGAEGETAITRDDGYVSPETMQHFQYGLDRKRAFRAAITPTVLSGMVVADVPKDWEDLTGLAYSAVQRSLMSDDLEGYAAVCREDPEELYKSVMLAAEGGIATTTAFLEVTPRVLVRAGQSVDQATVDAPHTALRSRGFINAWAGVEQVTDPELADYFRRTGTYEKRTAFEDLRFEVGMFKNNDGRIAVRHSIFLDRTEMYGLQPLGSVARKRPNALFGCPAAIIIKKLYPQMVAVAETGLFEQAARKEAEYMHKHDMSTKQ